MEQGFLSGKYPLGKKVLYVLVRRGMGRTCPILSPMRLDLILGLRTLRPER